MTGMSTMATPPADDWNARRATPWRSDWAAGVALAGFTEPQTVKAFRRACVPLAGVISCRRFNSARLVREAIGYRGRLGFCSALVSAWWQRVMVSQDGITPLMDPDPATATEVLNRQILSIHFTRMPTLLSAVDPCDRRWYTIKYGDLTLGELRQVCRRCGARSLFELDLIMQHGCRITYRSQHRVYGRAVLRALSAGRAGLRLIIMRFRGADRQNRPTGHRMAAVKERSGWRIFDPNCGEFRLGGTASFALWVGRYWRALGYDRRLGAGGGQSLAIYRFGAPLQRGLLPRRLTLSYGANMKE
jgi:hypothetical protein